MRHASTSQRAGEGWTLRTRRPEHGASARGNGAPEIAPDAPDVRLTLPARPASIAVARHVLGALAAAVGLPPHVCDDIRLAVTEACTNVVRHAYHHEPGHIAVSARSVGDALQIVVSDSGQGIGPSPDARGPGFGLGLISTLADRLEIDHAPGEGSRLQMWFARHRPIPETA
jgi:serine/threonine-protein kinase RsbW